MNSSVRTLVVKANKTELSSLKRMLIGLFFYIKINQK